jgi:hypothetical protein
MSKFDKGDICVSVYVNKFIVGKVDYVEFDAEDEELNTVHYTDAQGKSWVGFQNHLFTFDQAMKEVKKWIKIGEEIDSIRVKKSVQSIIKTLEEDGKVIVTSGEYEAIKEYVKDCIVIPLPNDKVAIELDIKE